MSFAASMTMHNEIHQAEDTDASVKIALTDSGICPTHPDILLRKKKEKFWGGYEWKIILPHCPCCEAERQLKLENQRRDRIQPALLPTFLPDPTAPPQSADSTTSLATSGSPLDNATPEGEQAPTDAKGKDAEKNSPGNSDRSPKSGIIAHIMPKKEDKNDNNDEDAAVWRLDGGKLLRGIRCFIPEDKTLGFQVNDYLKSCNIFLQVPTIHPENDLKASDCEEKQLFFMASDSSKAKIEALIKTCGVGYVADFDTFASASSRTSSFSSAVEGNGKDNGASSSLVSATSSDGWFLAFTEKKERVIVLPLKDMMPSEEVCDEASRVTDRSSALRFLKRYGSHVPAGDQVLGGYSLRWTKAKGNIRVAEAALVVGDSSDVSQRNTEASVEATTTSDESSKEATSERDSVASQHAEGTQQRAGSMVAGGGSPCVVSRGDVGAFVPVWRVLEKIKSEEQDGCTKFSTAIELLRDTWYNNLLDVADLLRIDSILSHGDYFMRLCEILVQEDASKGGSFTSSDANSFICKLREKVNPPPPSPPSTPDKSPVLPPAPRHLPVETTPYPMYVVERERRSIAGLLSFLRNTCKMTAAHAKEVTIAFIIKKGIFSEDMLVALVKSSWFKERKLQSIVGNKNVAHIIAEATANRAVSIPKPVDILEDEKLLLEHLGKKLAMDAEDVANLTDLYIAMINNVPMLSCVAISLCEHIYHSMKTVHTATICKIFKATYPPNDLTNVYKTGALAALAHAESAASQLQTEHISSPTFKAAANRNISPRQNSYPPIIDPSKTLVLAHANTNNFNLFCAIVKRPTLFSTIILFATALMYIFFDSYPVSEDCKPVIPAIFAVVLCHLLDATKAILKKISFVFLRSLFLSQRGLSGLCTYSSSFSHSWDSVGSQDIVQASNYLFSRCLG
eukprot:gene23866-28893_t